MAPTLSSGVCCPGCPQQGAGTALESGSMSRGYPADSDFSRGPTTDAHQPCRPPRPLSLPLGRGWAQTTHPVPTEGLERASHPRGQQAQGEKAAGGPAVPRSSQALKTRGLWHRVQPEMAGDSGRVSQLVATSRAGLSLGLPEDPVPGRGQQRHRGVPGGPVPHGAAPEGTLATLTPTEGN